MRLNRKQTKVFRQMDIHTINFHDVLDLDDKFSKVDGTKKFGLTKEEIVLQMKRNRT